MFMIQTVHNNDIEGNLTSLKTLNKKIIFLTIVCQNKKNGEKQNKIIKMGYI